MGLITYIKNKRRSRHDRKALRDYGHQFATLSNLQRNGLIRWVRKDRRLFISEPVAILMMAHGVQSWENFLQNVFLWQYYKLLQEQWDSYIYNEQRKAVLARKAKGIKTSRQELDVLRQQVRDSIRQEDVPLPPINKFEFFVLGANDSGKSDDSSQSEHNHPQAKIILVGEYNPETELFEQAEWDAVSARFASLLKE